MFYLQRGEVPHKRHTQFRKPDGGLYAEELFGVEGFSGRASLLYHHTPPTQTHQIEKVRDVRLEQTADEASGAHRHRLVNTKDLEPSGDGVTGRVPLFYNVDVTFGVVLPAEPMERYYRNGEADEMYFVHTGEGVLETNFGPIEYGPGDYLVIPIGTTFRLRPVRRTTSGCSGSSRPRRSCRRSATATTSASCWSTRRTASATSARRPRWRRSSTTATS